MAEYCEGGQFDGYVMTTLRDKQLCGDGGGIVVPRKDNGGGCAGDTVQSYAAARGGQVDANPLHAAKGVWRGNREEEVLTQLSEAAVGTVESIIRDDPQLADELVSALRRLAEKSAAALDAELPDAVYGEEDHEYFSKLARVVAERAQDDRLTELVESAVSLGESYVGLTSRDIQERLGPLPEPIDVPEGKTTYDLLVPAPDIDDGYAPKPWQQRPVLTRLDPVSWGRLPIAEILEQMRQAEAAIAEKARALGGIAASPTGDMKPVADGWVRTFVDCDIYFSPATGAHEVHGEIRRKYRQVNGPARLGLPTTDESTCFDKRGKYNHFAKSASIYWSPNTGPFFVRGAVRFRWASLGWEASTLGYPVRDEEGLAGLYPQDNPDMYWSHFQHGMIFSQGADGQIALAASVPMERIKDAIFKVVDRRLPSRSFTIGLISVTARPGLYGVDYIGTDDWQYGFDASSPRILRLKIRGFVSLPIVPDPTFEIEIGLRFTTMWRATDFMYPATKTLVATLASSSASADGLGKDAVVDAINEAMASAFSPDPSHPEVSGPSMVVATVPTGANQKGSGNLDFLDVMLMADGSLAVFVNPIDALVGRYRQYFAQKAIDSALENL